MRFNNQLFALLRDRVVQTTLGPGGALLEFELRRACPRCAGSSEVKNTASVREAPPWSEVSENPATHLERLRGHGWGFLQELETN